MPTRDENGKRLSGAGQDRKKLGLDAPVPRGALPAEFDAGPVPDDPLDLQVWGCRQLALNARMKATRPDLIDKAQHDGIRNDLATMGMLFPRAQLVSRLQKATAAHKDKGAKDELRPLDGIDPGPTSRSGR